MQGLILAAGMGNRLGKYTKNNTKGMVEINGSKMIDLSLERLYEVGIRKTILVVGYKADNIHNYIGDNYRDMKIIYVENEIYDKTNNIYSLWLAKDELIKEDTILLESDLVFETRVLKNLINCKHENSAVVAPFERWMDGTVTLVNDKKEITSFISKANFDWSGTKSYYKTVNIYKFSKKFSENTYIPFLEAYIKTLGDNEYYEQVLRVISHLDGIKIHANILSDEKWYEVDDAQDLDIAEVIFSKGKDKLNKLQNRYGGYWRFPRIKDFCYLVNPYFPTPVMLSEITYNFKTLTAEYPSGLNTQNLLGAKMFNLFDDNQILVGNGAAELIKSLAHKIEGTFGIVFPSFNEYSERIGKDRVVNFIPSNKNLEYNADDLIEFSKEVDNLLLINPDNPSGSFIPEKDVLRLLKHLKQNGKNLIYDESFIDFAHNDNFFTLLSDEILN
ncbi:MAG: aminotransferase class I/II-fold pyridoxal phosphate-dependent enzyme, partial [Flavobacteriales bacterium]|nr:aminotransferase class I/II-fold pyridoxal phosphate-dependent enzyme [Flavobacteriales bacterium]